MAEELAAILPQEFGLQMIGVVHAGVPNHERVVLRANYPLDLSAYFLVLGWRITDDRAWPLNADSFWFGKTTVAAGHWVLSIPASDNRRSRHSVRTLASSC